MQGAHVTQELPAKAQHVSAKGDEDKGEAAIGLHCIVRYGVPLESKMDSAYRKVMSCAVLHGGLLAPLTMPFYFAVWKGAKCEVQASVAWPERANGSSGSPGLFSNYIIWLCHSSSHRQVPAGIPKC